MAHPGQELHGPGGYRLLIVARSDELLEMEATYPGGDMPPEHLHPSQSERFEVLEGRMRARIDGAEREYAPGDVFDVPAGTVHTMAGDAGTRVRWEVRPALRTAEFFEGLYTGAAAEDGAAFLAEFAPEFRLA